MEITGRNKFEDISQDTQDFFDNLISKISLPYDLRYLLIHADRQKQIVKLHKLNEMMSFVTKYDVIVSFNENLFDVIEDETIKEILILQEIDKITVNIETGKITFVKPDVITFSGLINKYGMDAVARANQLDSLTTEQMQDKLTEEFMRK